MSNRGNDVSSWATYDITESSDGRTYRRHRSQIAGRRDDEDDNYTPRIESRTRRPSNAAPSTGQTPGRHAGGDNRHTLLTGSSALPFESLQPDSVHQLSTDRHNASASRIPNYYNPFLMAPGSAVPRSEQSRSSQPQDYTSSLSALGQAFAIIPANDFKRCEKFIKDNPKILEEDEKDFVKEAATARICGNDALAKSCLQQSVLLGKCRGLSSRKRKGYFDDLKKKNQEALRDLSKKMDKAMDQTGEQIPGSDQPPSQRMDLPGRMSALEVVNRHDRQQSDNQNGNPGGDDRLTRYRNSGSANNRPTHVTRGDRHGGLPRGTLSSGSNGPTSTHIYGSKSVGGDLDYRYTVRPNSNAFFTVGRVFSTLWHSSYGSGLKVANGPTDNRKSSVRPGRFGEQIISHIQRMAVVKEEHGFCWCIPINSYHGKGVGKIGLSATDVKAHAIIHMNNENPQTSSSEPEMIKIPIAVTPASEEQQLDKMSRVNFAKVHTVEHNVKVMDVGRVTDKSLPYFVSYWTNQAKQILKLADRR